MKFPPSARQLLPVILVLALQTATARGMDVQFDSQRQQITIDAENAPLSSVLREIAGQAGFVLRFDPGVDRRITIAGQRQPLAGFLDGLARLQHLNLILGWETRNGSRRIATVAVLPEGSSDVSRLPVLKPRPDRAERKRLREERKLEKERSRAQKKAQRAAGGTSPASPAAPPPATGNVPAGN